MEITDRAIGIAGLVVSLAGFAISIWQIVKARTAAEAALAASNRSISAALKIQSISNIHDICGRCRDLLHLTRAKNLKAAATAAFEARDLISRFQATESAHKTDNSTQWQEIISIAKTTHERLESAAMISRIDAKEREILIHEISELNSMLRDGLK